jgi:hypothetical protein
LRLLFALGLLQRGELAFGQHQAFLSDLGFERLEPFLHRLKIMALPDPAHPGRRNRMAEGRRAVLQAGLRRVSSCSANSPPASSSSLTVKAVTRITHHFAGLADIAKLSGKLQQSHLGAAFAPCHAVGAFPLLFRPRRVRYSMRSCAPSPPRRRRMRALVRACPRCLPLRSIALQTLALLPSSLTTQRFDARGFAAMIDSPSCESPQKRITKIPTRLAEPLEGGPLSRRTPEHR